MPVKVSYPGVYLQEASSGVRTVTGVSTSIPLLIGRTERGIQRKPTRIFNFLDYVRNFGPGTQQGEMAHQVRQFFNNGGTQAYIMKIAKGAEEASVNLKNEAGSTILITTAKEAGVYGAQIRLEVDFDTPTPDKTFNLGVFRHIENNDGDLLIIDEERFINLTMDKMSNDYAPDKVSQTSKLISLTEPSAVVARNPAELVAGIMADTKAAMSAKIATIIAAGHNRLRLKVGDTGTYREVDLTGVTDVDEFERLLRTIFSDDVSLPTDLNADTVPSGGINIRLFSIKNNDSGNIEIKGTGNPRNDFAKEMQLGVVNGGMEIGADANRRPAPSGLFFDYGGTEFDNLRTFAELHQGDLANIIFDGENIAVNLFTTSASAAERMSLGTAALGDSLLNVREKLLRLVKQFNDAAKGLPNFHWVSNLQGLRLVFKLNTGDANSGLSASIVSSTSPILGGPTGAIKTRNSRFYSLGSTGGGDFQATGVSGSNGLKPISENYEEAFNIVSQEVDIFNLLILPRDQDDNEDRTSYWSLASVFARDQRAFLLVDPPKIWKSVNDITDGSPNVEEMRNGLVKDHAAVYWPRIFIVDPAENEQTDIDPSGTIAGLMARTDANRGVWKAPAGIEAGLRAVRGVEHDISDRENGVINPQAVNAIRVFPNGIVSWGARTMDGFDNSGNDDYKYVPVRRFTLFIEESLYRGLKFAVFEPNDEPLWAQIRLAAGAFMNNLFRQGAFQGQKKSDAYFVKCDTETTTQNDINLGIVNVLVGFAPLKPAEFVVITIQQIAGQVQT